MRTMAILRSFQNDFFVKTLFGDKDALRVASIVAGLSRAHNSTWLVLDTPNQIMRRGTEDDDPDATRNAWLG
jgi:hypothetical protein